MYDFNLLNIKITKQNKNKKKEKEGVLPLFGCAWRGGEWKDKF